MKKWICVVLIGVVLAGMLGLWMDLRTIQEGTVRLHVVAVSDSEEDQAEKLRVRDAVIAYLQPVLAQAANREEALEILAGELDSLEFLANGVLANSGRSVEVTLGEETFPRRDYDTFSLPAGVYQALRIRIGEAAGKNWWCVVFPSFCVGAASEDFRDAAVSSGFSEPLTETLAGEYELRFFFLDCLGSLQNFFFGS